MTGPTPTKSSKEKQNSQTATPSRKPAHQSTLVGPQADLMALQDAAGNQAVSQLLTRGSDQPGLIQTKLTIGQPGDPYEQQADHIADKVIDRPAAQIGDQPTEAGAAPPQPLNQAGQPVAGETILQAKAAPGQTSTVPPGIQSHVSDIQSSAGEPLPAETREFMEGHFGQNFSQVRIHRDAKATSLASSLKARAFTIGNHIVFGAGEFQINSLEGRRILAHELVHTVQQTEGRFTSVIQRSLLDEDQPNILSATRSLFKKEAPDTSKETTVSDRLEDHPELRDRIKSYSNQLIYYIFEELTPILKYYVGNSVIGAATANRLYSLKKVASKFRKKQVYDAADLSEWLDKSIDVLKFLVEPLRELRNVDKNAASYAQILDQTRKELHDQALTLSKHPFFQLGQRQAAAQKAEKMRADRVKKVIHIMRRYARKAGSGTGLGLSNTFEGVLGDQLARELKGFSSEELTEAFSRLKEDEQQTYDRALFKGFTTVELANRGKSGLSDFGSKGQGFVAGFTAKAKDLELTKPTKTPEFSFLEKGKVGVGFEIGVAEGLAQAIYENLKTILAIFSKEFWEQMSQLLTETVPQLIRDEEFRFLLGGGIAELLHSEIIELNASDPFEYGRKIGNWFGMLVLEIALTFLTGGAALALKGLKGAKLLRKFPTLVKVAEKIATSTLAKKGVLVTAQIAKMGANVGRAISNTIQRARNIIAISSRAKAAKEISKLAITEIRLIQKIKKAEQARLKLENISDSVNPKKLSKTIEEVREAESDLKQEIDRYEKIYHTEVSQPKITPEAGEALPASSPGATPPPWEATKPPTSQIQIGSPASQVERKIYDFPRAPGRIRGPRKFLERHQGRLESENGALEDIFRRSSHPNNPVARRSAAGELAIIQRYLERGAPDGRQIKKIVVVPSKRGSKTQSGESADFIVEFDDGTKKLLEATTVTSAPQGRHTQKAEVSETVTLGKKGERKVEKQKSEAGLQQKTLERRPTQTAYEDAIRRKAVPKHPARKKPLQVEKDIEGVEPGGIVAIHSPFGKPDDLSMIQRAMDKLSSKIHARVQRIEFSFGGTSLNASVVFERVGDRFILQGTP